MFNPLASLYRSLFDDSHRTYRVSKSKLRREAERNRGWSCPDQPGVPASISPRARARGRLDKAARREKYKAKRAGRRFVRKP